MKKFKLNMSEVLDSTLTREQLKGIMGGSGSGSEDIGCEGKTSGQSCNYYYNGQKKSGHCKSVPFCGFCCWGD